MEISARVYIYIKYNTQHAGLEMRKMHLNYEPYVMYGKKWKEVFNKYITQKNENNLNVLLLGGSTAENFPIKILEDSLTNHLGNKVDVYSGAMGGYISSQELVILTRYGFRLKPDIIINLNGSNDITQSLRQDNKPGTFFLNSTYEIFIKKPFLAPIVKLLQYSQLYNGLVRLSERSIKFDSKNYVEFINVYIDNIINMNLFSKAIGSEYFNFIQPNVIFKLKKK